MNITMTLFTTLLFVLLTPGMLLRIPPGGSKLTVALVHGLIFALLYHFTHKMVWRALYEGFQAAGATATVMACEKDADCTAPMKCKAKKCSA